METNKTAGKIEAVADTILLFSVYAHIRPVLRDSGVCLDTGVVLFVPDYGKKDSLLRSLEQCGAIRKTIYRNKLPTGFNFQMILIEYRPSLKREVIEEFLENDEYLSVLVVPGILPEFLQGRDIMYFDDIETSMEQGVLRKEIFGQFTDFVHKNVSGVVDIITRFEEVKKSRNIDKKPTLYQVLVCIALVYCYYKALALKKPEVGGDYLNILEGRIETMYREIEKASMGVEVLSTVRKVLLNYVDQGLEILVGDIDQVEGEMFQAVQEDKAILYDQDYYYIPDKLFRQITVPLQQVVSYSALKQALFQEGVLICNSTADNFTIKKLFYSAYGAALRLRFLKLSRSQIDGNGQLGLMERGKLCVSGEM